MLADDGLVCVDDFLKLGEGEGYVVLLVGVVGGEGAQAAVEFLFFGVHGERERKK